MTSGLETVRAYSGFGASQICHLFTYTYTYLPTYSPGPTRLNYLTSVVLSVGALVWKREGHPACNDAKGSVSVQVEE